MTGPHRRKHADNDVTEDAAISTSEARVRGFPYRKPAVVIAHAVLFALALFAAFLNAYDFRWTLVDRSGVSYRWYLDLYLPLLALALPSKLLIFYWARQYRSSWRYVGLRDLFNVISASLVASFTFLSVYFLLENGWERALGQRLIDDGPVVHLRQSSVFLLDWAATIAFVCVARVLFRFYYEARQPGRSERTTRVLVVGAGDTGEAVVRQLFRTRRERYECVGFLDDNDANLHGRIHDIEILGRTSQIREICLSHRVEEVLIALPDAGPKTIRRLVERCNATGVRFRTIPDVADVIEGRVQVSQLRDVDITDLLGRAPVELDTEKIGRQLRGQCVLVTGAGGSIGSEMCRQIAAFGPRRLVLLEQAENTLFEIERELRAKHADLSIGAYVGDIIDRQRVGAVLGLEKPSVVFHAAAHKHVPLMETNAGEAIKNNIGGTASLADACAAGGVERMVLISTDKAINPTSIMGCSKRIAELYVQSCNARASTQFVTVRFGNVLGSSGSVVPIFREQIAAGGPVTVTHEDMTRFFMTIPEAAQLVLQAGTMGKGGEIYILHMGEPVKILDLARDMISLSGLRPGVDIDIVFTGTRPGEKLFEELSGAGEDIGDTTHPKIGIWKPRSNNWDSIRGDVERLLKVADTYNKEQLQAELRAIVPEYGPDRSSRNPANGVVAKAP